MTAKRARAQELLGTSQRGAIAPRRLPRARVGNREGAQMELGRRKARSAEPEPVAGARAGRRSPSRSPEPDPSSEPSRSPVAGRPGRELSRAGTGTHAHRVKGSIVTIASREQERESPARQAPFQSSRSLQRSLAKPCTAETPHTAWSIIGRGASVPEGSGGERGARHAERDVQYRRDWRGDALDSSAGRDGPRRRRPEEGEGTAVAATVSATPIPFFIVLMKKLRVPLRERA
jgi:hypothetical protein